MGRTICVWISSYNSIVKMLNHASLLSLQSLSPSATTLHFEYYLEEGEARSGAALQVIHLPSVDQHRDQTAGHVMERLLADHKVPTNKQVRDDRTL